MSRFGYPILSRNSGLADALHAVDVPYRHSTAWSCSGPLGVEGLTVVVAIWSAFNVLRAATAGVRRREHQIVVKFSNAPRNITRIAELKRPSALPVPTRARIIF
jgi:hypothetical protein